MVVVVVVKGVTLARAAARAAEGWASARARAAVVRGVASAAARAVVVVASGRCVLRIGVPASTSRDREPCRAESVTARSCARCHRCCPRQPLRAWRRGRSRVGPGGAPRTCPWQPGSLPPTTYAGVPLSCPLAPASLDGRSPGPAVSCASCPRRRASATKIRGAEPWHPGWKEGNGLARGGRHPSIRASFSFRAVTARRTARSRSRRRRGHTKPR